MGATGKNSKPKFNISRPKRILTKFFVDMGSIYIDIFSFEFCNVIQPISSDKKIVSIKKVSVIGYIIYYQATSIVINLLNILIDK